MRFLSSRRLTLCVNPKSPSKFLHFELPFISSLRVFIDTSNLVCGLNIASPSLFEMRAPAPGKEEFLHP